MPAHITEHLSVTLHVITN